jgi:hypothetical protein
MRYYLAVAAALALQASAARAETIVALVGGDILVTIDGSAAKATGLTKIDGIGSVVGVDVRPADGQLYALASDGTVAIIDPVSGKATPKAKLDTPLPEGVRFSVDFNPVADKMRIIGADGTNLRANVDDGKITKDQPLKFADTDPAKGQTPAVVAGAYTNAIKGAKETTLYDIDAELGGLFRQAPPNDGILTAIGMLGLDVESIGFDIVTDGAGANTGMLVAKGNLYTVDLASGKATGGKAIVGLPADVRDIATLPAIGKKQAAAPMMNADGLAIQAKADTTSAYLPMATSGTMSGGMAGGQPKPAMQMKAGYGMKMGTDKKSQYRADSSMQQTASSSPKMKRGPQCDERKAQY